MKTLHNTTPRIFNLPIWREDGRTAQSLGIARKAGATRDELQSETFGGQALQPGEKLEAPDWYVERLRESSKMMAHLIDAETGTISQQRRIGSRAQEDIEAARRAKARKTAAELAAEPTVDKGAKLPPVVRSTRAKAEADDTGNPGGPDAGGRTKATETTTTGGRKRGE
jgi:hypothetical protein